MSGNESLNSSYSNGTQQQAFDDAVAVRAATLVLMQCFIIPGNALILAAIASFKKFSVSDVLIGCLALVDLINGLGPVNISLAMYYAGAGGFKHDKKMASLCLLYSWSSCCLRLIACFVATSMAIDRFAAIVVPLHYRTKVTPRLVAMCLMVLLTISVIVASIPLSNENITKYTPICSFDFTSGFAVFIAVLGYVQLLIVVLCYVSVILGVNAFLSRQTLIRATQIRASIAATRSKQRENTLAESSQIVVVPRSSQQSSPKMNKTQLLTVDHEYAFQKRLRSQSLAPGPSTGSIEISSRVNVNRSLSLTPQTTKRGSLSRILMSTTIKRSGSLSVTPQIKLNTDTCYLYSEENGMKRDVAFEAIQESQLESEDEAKFRLSLKNFKRNSSTWKHSRRLAIVMGIVVSLFYISWMPIVIVITLSLKSSENKPSLYFIAARMTLISSMLNFIVYGCMLKQYRQTYKCVLKKIILCGHAFIRRKSEDGTSSSSSKRKKMARANQNEKGKSKKKTVKRVQFRNAVSPIA